jgi:hypothetical protein
MAAQHAGKPAMLFGHRRAHVSPRVLAQRLSLARQAFALRFPLHDEPPVPGPPAVVGENPPPPGSRYLRRINQHSADWRAVDWFEPFS